MLHFFLEVAPDFETAVTSALVRAAYLFPELEFGRHGSRIQIQGASDKTEAAIRKELSYLIYRERVRRDFEPFRRKALARIFGPVA